MFEFINYAWRPILEILILWGALYTMFHLISGTRAVQILFGLILFAVFFQIAKFFGLNTIVWVFTKLFAFGMIALLILFHPELRRALERIGQTTIRRAFFQRGGAFDGVINACVYFARTKTGALIVLQRDVGLRSFVETGVLIDSRITEELIRTIFAKNTPLHDGAMIIRGERIISCGSLLPLTQNPNVSKTLGTRHRAGLGLTEETDAVCIIVSEETGNVSVAVYGKLTQNLDAESLRRVLRSLFVKEEAKSGGFGISKNISTSKGESA